MGLPTFVCTHSFVGDNRLLALRIITSANFDISALGMADNKNTSIFNQVCVFFPLTDLQPVKNQLNNLVCSAFPPHWYMDNIEFGMNRHAHTLAMASGQYDIWIVIVVCGECVFPLTADLNLSLHFVLDYIYFLS